MVSNFSVDSKGYCFLCLKKVSCQCTPTVKAKDAVDTSSSSSVYSLQDISRYLKLDMSKVFIEKGPIPFQLLAKVEKSRLKVELCDDCGNLMDNVSKHCRQLEKLKLEIESGLEVVHAKMLEANQTDRPEKFRRAVGSESNSGMGGWMEILDALRMETMEKSTRKLNKASPRLRIQKLSRKTISRRTFRPNIKQELEASSEPAFDSTLHGSRGSGSGQTEEPNCANWNLKLGDDLSENKFVDDLMTTDDGNDGESAQGSVKNTVEMLNRAMETDRNLQRKYIINSDTGKYKCQLCVMEYASEQGIRYHFNAVHRRIRIKCKICGKQFTKQSSYKRHHQNVHVGVRFQCQLCKKIFSLKHSLMTHQRNGECGVAMGHS